MCECGNAARYVRVYEKEVLTLHGLRVIPRAYYHCQICGKGTVPLDRALDLDRGSTSLRVRCKIARVAALTPFGRGSNELKELCGIEVSAKTFERVSEHVGQSIGMELAELERHILSGLADEPEAAPERLYVTLDGVMVPMGKKYQECKVGAVYEASLGRSGDVVARDIEHVGSMSGPDVIGDRLYCAAFRRGVERAKEVVVVADGAKWIWKQARENFPGCVEILDFYHAAEHLGEVAKARYGDELLRSEKWLHKCKAHLLEGRFGQVVRSMRAWKPVEPEHVKLLSETIGYFTSNRKRMRYDQFRAQGMHIGSGIAESSCKSLVQARLKQSGMHWSRDGAESILQLRRLWMDVPTADFTAYARVAN